MKVFDVAITISTQNGASPSEGEPVVRCSVKPSGPEVWEDAQGEEAPEADGAVQHLQELPSPELLRLLRRELGLGQSDVADRLGVSQVTVSRWENGKYLATSAYRSEVARQLHELAERIWG
jgi:DNA-binding XRE family transcriptional regulator